MTIKPMIAVATMLPAELVAITFGYWPVDTRCTRVDECYSSRAHHFKCALRGQCVQCGTVIAAALHSRKCVDWLLVQCSYRHTCKA